MKLINRIRSITVENTREKTAMNFIQSKAIPLIERCAGEGESFCPIWPPFGTADYVMAYFKKEGFKVTISDGPLTISWL